MPYLVCPSCRVTAYSAARYSTVEECPSCFAPLTREGARPAESRSAGFDHEGSGPGAERLRTRDEAADAAP
jgi:hypothetical protein